MIGVLCLYNVEHLWPSWFLEQVSSTHRVKAVNARWMGYFLERQTYTICDCACVCILDQSSWCYVCLLLLVAWHVVSLLRISYLTPALQVLPVSPHLSVSVSREPCETHTSTNGNHTPSCQDIACYFLCDYNYHFGAVIDEKNLALISSSFVDISSSSAVPTIN